MKTEWQSMAPPIPKGTPMPQTREYWIQMAAMDQELILEQQAEIERLKRKANQLRQRMSEAKESSPGKAPLLCESCGITEVTQTTEPHVEHGEVLVSHCEYCDFSYYQEPAPRC